MSSASLRLFDKLCFDVSKRLFDMIASGTGLILFSPFFLIVAVLIKADSRGPIFFRQVRVGRYETPFSIHKFRTMTVDAAVLGLQLTTDNDARITRVGAFLRRWKIDELPQLIDVFFGRMSLVGPRPEVPRYVKHYPVKVKDIVFSVRPGLTDLASIQYKDENKLLNKFSCPEKTYVEKILPVKLDLYVKYVQDHSFLGDLKIIIYTLRELAKTRGC
jgi:lipopolysaccharide/colanic/teichoic acid biosynthesis glycosyltransferase